MVTSYLHRNFSTTVFKMVMKHYHRFGYDAQSRKLLKLLSEDSASWGLGTETKKQNVKLKLVPYSPADARLSMACVQVSRKAQYFYGYARILNSNQ